MRSGDRLTLDIEKPAAGGRMLARHNGRVILVSGAIPGERVAARIERVSSAVVFAATEDVLSPSADRRPISTDPRCGGCVLSHVTHDRQLRLKIEIVQDAFARIARLPLTDAPAIVASPERGYRLRARLHAQGAKLGFFREGSHQLCEAATTGQLSEGAAGWVATAERWLHESGVTGLAGVELAENMSADQRVCHLELHSGADVRAHAPLAAGLTGLSGQSADRPDAIALDGDATVTDVLRFDRSEGPVELRLRRDVRSFFQANRFLVTPLAQHVVERVPDGPVMDLYAGVGVFGLALAAHGRTDLTLVEGDPIGSADLQRNAEPFAGSVRVERGSVESFVQSKRFADGSHAGATVIVDPPRTGLSPAVMAAIVQAMPAAFVYVSCDPATLARDCRGLVNAGYELTGMTLFDMFPNTAHVETVVGLGRR